MKILSLYKSLLLVAIVLWVTSTHTDAKEASTLDTPSPAIWEDNDPSSLTAPASVRCHAKIASIGHLDILTGLLKKEGLVAFPDLLDSLINTLNKGHYDAVILTGDITGTNTPEEWKLVQHFIDQLQAEVYVTPGNHELAGAHAQNAYFTMFDYTSKTVNIKGCQVYLLNSSYDPKGDFTPIERFTGGLDDASLSLLKGIDDSKTNLIFMHHNILELDEARTSPQVKPTLIKSKEQWEAQAVPLLKNKGLTIWSGDHFKNNLSVTSKDGIQYITASFIMVGSPLKPLMYLTIYASDEMVKTRIEHLDLPKTLVSTKLAPQAK